MLSRIVNSDTIVMEFSISRIRKLERGRISRSQEDLKKEEAKNRKRLKERKKGREEVRKKS